MTYWKQAFENYTDWREAQFESISYDVCVHCKKIVDAGDEHILVCAKNGISKLPFFDHQGYQVSEKKFEEIYHLKVQCLDRQVQVSYNSSKMMLKRVV